MKVSEDCSIKDDDLNTIKKSTINNLVKPSLIALAVAQSLSMSSVQAATIHVGGPNGTGCGLAQAILSANSDISAPGSQCAAGLGDDVIELNQDVILNSVWDQPGYFQFYAGLPVILSNLTINGNGHKINRDVNAPNFGIIRARGNQLILNDITISNGAEIPNGAGGPTGLGLGSAVDTSLTNLIINNSTISNNIGKSAIFVWDGSVSLSNTTISGNNRGLDTLGGAIEITDSIISDNAIGVYATQPASINVTDSFVDNNGRAVKARSRDTGGLPLDSLIESVKIKNSSISNNSAGGLDLASVDNIEIIDSNISNNTSDSCAGLLVSPRSPYAGNHLITIENSTISNNISETNGGGACFYSNQIPHYSGSYIEGISTPSVNIINSTFVGNSAGQNGGAIIFQGPTSYNRYIGQADFFVNISNTITNSTFSSNSAGLMGGALFLGGEDNYSIFGNSGSRRLNLINSTVVENESSSHGSGIATAVNQSKMYLNLINSIIAGNGDSNLRSDINHLAALSYPNEDLVESKNNVLGSSLKSNFRSFTGFIPSATDITATLDGTSPAMLEDIVSPLQNNGGSTQTHALPVGSPAVDAGDIGTCLNEPVNGLDQRGEIRGELNLCDIGAYELGITGDLPSISVELARPSVYEGNANDSRVIVYTFTLSSPQTENVSFDFQTMDQTALGNVDYETRSGTVTFPAGQVSQIRAIKLIGDTDAEADETFKVVLSNPTNNAALDPDQSEAIGTILNDDFGGNLPSISVESAKPAVYEGSTGDRRVIAYTFKLSSPQTESVSFDYQTVDETAVGSVDYEIRSGRVTFTPGQVNQVRAIKLIGDTNVEADETFKVVLSNPSGNAELDLNQSEALGTILNDEFGGSSAPSIGVESAKSSVYEGDAGDNRVIVYTFTLSSPQSEEVSFDYQTIDETATGGVDYQFRSGTVTFTPGQVSQVRAIQLIGDSEVEANETFKIVLSNPSGNAELDLNKSEALGTILNNDF